VNLFLGKPLYWSKRNEIFAKCPLSKYALISPISALGSNFNPPDTQCISVFKMFAFLELEQISADFEIEHFSKFTQ